MKLLKFHLILALSSFGCLQAGVLSMTNNLNSTAGDTAIVNVNNNLITNGIAVSGYFNVGYDVDAGLANSISTSNFVAFLNSFNATVSDTIGVSGGSGLNGFYFASGNYGAPDGDPPLNGLIYTLLGNASTLSASTQLGLLRSDQTFNSDSPTPDDNTVLLGRNGNTSGGNVTILFGSIGTDTAVNFGSGSVMTPTLKLTAIPEPSACLLTMLGSLLLLRRKR